MQTQNTYQKNSLKRLLFASVFLISLSFSPGYVNYVATSPLQRTKTELVVYYKAKTPGWIKSLHKNVSLKIPTKSHALNAYKDGFLCAFNSLTKVKFKFLSQKNSLIKFSDSFIRVKTIPQTSKEIDFISFAG